MTSCRAREDQPYPLSVLFVPHLLKSGAPHLRRALISFALLSVAARCFDLLVSDSCFL
jgi:hypothetical protein